MARDRLTRCALRIFQAALKASDPGIAIRRHLSIDHGVLKVGRARYHLDRYRHIFVIGAGKAGAAMAQAMERLLGKRIADSLINVKYGHTARLRYVQLNECGHPVPDANGMRGAERIAEIASKAGEKDLVICLISGGASALMPLPAAGVSLEAKQRLTQLLLACGASIHEINCLRKHLSRIKGGQLARLAYPASVLTLVLSDVIGDDLDVIGSGPTVPDSSAFADARAILDKYKLWRKIPSDIARHIRAARDETPKPGDAAFERARTLVVGSNRQAVDAAASMAREQGFRTLVLSTFIQGETRDVASVHAAIAKEIRASGHPVRPPACIISGGETTVTLRGKGLGGRNQEFALAAAIEIGGLRDTVILSAGTDGSDGPTDATGAIATSSTVERARALGLDAARHLAVNGSYPFFDALGDLIKTGPTGTNVMDIRVILVA